MPAQPNPPATPSTAPLVGVVMGSRSDWETLQHAVQKLDALGVPYEVKVVSAHRTPDVLFEYAASARARGLRALYAALLEAGRGLLRAAEKTADFYEYLLSRGVSQQDADGIFFENARTFLRKNLG